MSRTGIFQVRPNRTRTELPASGSANFGSVRFGSGFGSVRLKTEPNRTPNRQKACILVQIKKKSANLADDNNNLYYS